MGGYTSAYFLGTRKLMITFKLLIWIYACERDGLDIIPSLENSFFDVGSFLYDLLRIAIYSLALIF